MRQGKARRGSKRLQAEDDDGDDDGDDDI